MKFNSSFIKSVLLESEFFGKEIIDNPTFSVDSRTLARGDFFIALKGETVDGHDYILDALNKGASGIMISQRRREIIDKISIKVKENISILLVDDTYDALLKLAAKWRQLFNIPIIGVTGSVGKTTTKEIICNILKTAGKNFIASHGNQNTAILLSINIFRMNFQHEVAVFEIGVSRRGEMAKIVQILMPTIGVITAIGHSHMEGLGSLLDIAVEKRDIFKFFKDNNIGIINGDLPILADISYSHPIIKFGTKTINQIQARKIQTSPNGITFILKIYKEKFNISLKTNHIGYAMNCLAAATVGYLLNINTKKIIEGIMMNLSIPERFDKKMIKDNKGILINDAYNASPESMKAAITAFENMDSKGKKLAVFSDMLELGVNGPFWHRQIGRFLRKAPSISYVLLVGDQVKYIKETLPARIEFDWVLNLDEAKKILENKLSPDCAVLFKGSRGTELRKLAKEFSNE